MKTINVTNDYCQERFEVLCEELEKGERVHIYVDCIGHTRSEWVEDEYVTELKKKYSEKLHKEGSYWTTAYYLK